MLQRALKLEDTFAIFRCDQEFRNNPVSKLTDLDRDIMRKLEKLLKPFEQVTVDLSYRDATIADVIPDYLVIKLYLHKASTKTGFTEFFHGVGTTIDAFYEDVKRRFEPMLTDSTLCLSTFLNPTYKLVKQQIDQEKLTEFVLAFNTLVEEDESTDLTNIPVSENPTVTPTAPVEQPLDFFACLEELGTTQSDDNTSSQQSTQEEESIVMIEATPASQLNVSGQVQRRSLSLKEQLNARYKQEIADYLSLPLLAKSHRDAPRPNIFAWWADARFKFPLLAKLALRYLSCPPSSVESERLFSSGGKIYEDARNRLTSERGEQLMLLHYNLKALKAYPHKKLKL